MAGTIPLAAPAYSRCCGSDHHAFSLPSSILGLRREERPTLIVSSPPSARPKTQGLDPAHRPLRITASSSLKNDVRVHPYRIDAAAPHRPLPASTRRPVRRTQRTAPTLCRPRVLDRSPYRPAGRTRPTARHLLPAAPAYHAHPVPHACRPATIRTNSRSAQNPRITQHTFNIYIFLPRTVGAEVQIDPAHAGESAYHQLEVQSPDYLSKV
ncbi:hypothetical protein B0H16DRAFT_1720117 [Mycena metata]|uniref:Uncharacterized protein n=1 Tax=Mycena metata TaxID=1033252 RepID=A0AAD7JAX7_9AGAR|nr:hypothetical protein B0H16DRAFT_1720117 [Mycena metata]